MSGVVVMGATGGCGATTFACALALARCQAGQAVLLVDLDAHGGGPAALWGIPATRALDDLRALGDHLDAAHVEHLVHRHPSGVDVLAGAREPGALFGWTDEAVDVVSGYVGSRASWVVDAGRGDTALARALARRAEQVVLIAPRTVQGARRGSIAARAVDGLRVAGVATDMPAGERVPERALARALGMGVVASAPRDDRAAARVCDAQPVRGRGLARAVAALEADG